MTSIVSLMAIAFGLAILIALSTLYLRTSRENIKLSQLKTIAKSYFLGNTAALKPFQKSLMMDPNNWDEYDAVLYEPDAVKEHVFWPCVISIVTVFIMSCILFTAFEFGYYHRPSMILGGALKIGSAAEGCLYHPSTCDKSVQQMVDAYQLG